MEIWIERREDESVVFKSLLEMKLEKSVIWLLLSAFIVHHHCLGRMIIQRSLHQNSRDNLCPSSIPPWWEEQMLAFRSYRPGPRRSVHHCLILTLRMNDEWVLKMEEFWAFFCVRSEISYCPPKSSIYSLWGAITITNHGGVEVVLKLPLMGV